MLPLYRQGPPIQLESASATICINIWTLDRLGQWPFLRRCLSVAYSPQRRECRLSGFDQRDSRILYDPLFDYYENLVTGVPPPLGESANFSVVIFFLRARVCWTLLFLCRPFCIFERCLDSNPQGAAVACRCATNLATHLNRNLVTHVPSNLASHLPTYLSNHLISMN
jgi:hypothetical protein